MHSQNAPAQMHPSIVPGPDKQQIPRPHPLTKTRVPHISLVFREMWDTAGLALKPPQHFLTPWNKGPSTPLVVPLSRRITRR
jgi:hypothetical protein